MSCKRYLLELNGKGVPQHNEEEPQGDKIAVDIFKYLGDCHKEEE